MTVGAATHPLDGAVAAVRDRVRAARRSLDGSLTTAGQLVAVLDALLAAPAPPGAPDPERDAALATLRAQRDTLTRFAIPHPGADAIVRAAVAGPTWSTAYLVETAEGSTRTTAAIGELARQVLDSHARVFARWREVGKRADAPAGVAGLLDEWLSYLALAQRVADAFATTR